MTQPATTQIVPSDALTSTASFPTSDTITIEGVVSPGKAVLQNIKLPKDWQKNKGYGLSGATLVPLGDDLATFQIRFSFWLPSQVAAWRDYWTKFFSKQLVTVAGAAQPMALNIVHGRLAFHGLGPCVVTDAGGLEKDDLGEWFHVVSFQQYRKAKPALQKPIATIPGASTAKPTAQDAQDRAIQERQATAASLSDGAAAAISTPVVP